MKGRGSVGETKVSPTIKKRATGVESLGSSRKDPKPAARYRAQSFD
jgi:hypothetical protein